MPLVFPGVWQLWQQTIMPGSIFYSLGHLQQQNISKAALVPSSDVQEKMRIQGEVDGKLCPVKGGFLCA